MKILLVDDNEEIRSLIKDSLEDQGYEVEDFAEPSLALDCLELVSFDCIVTDYNMPGMDGAEFATIARRIQQNVPIFMITAALEHPDCEAVLRVFEKIQIKELVEEVKIFQDLKYLTKSWPVAQK